MLGCKVIDNSMETNVKLGENCLLVEFWKAEECCDLEDGANMHFLVCVEGKKS